MRQQSASSISSFLRCPHAYELKYVRGIEGETSDKMGFGKWVEEQIFSPQPAVDALAYQTALNDWLAANNDAVTETQHHVEFEVGGYAFQGYIDFLTLNGVAGEIKVTTSPAYYQQVNSYQMRMYDLAFRARGDKRKLKYFLFEYEAKTGEFKHLHVVDYVQTDLGAVEASKQIAAVCEMVALCETSGAFPPSLNGCATCLWKKNCSYYFGY